MKLRFLLLFVLAIGMNAMAQNTVTNVTNFPNTVYGDLASAVAVAQPGDELTLSAGEYYESVNIGMDITLTPAAGVSLSTLALENGCSVTLKGSMTVMTSLALGNGFIQFTNDADRMVMSAGATVTRVSGYVKGTLEKKLDVVSVNAGAYISMKFEIGDALGYTPIDLSLYHVEAGSGSVTVSTTGGEFTDILVPSCINALQSVNRKYAIVNSGLTYNNYAAKLTFLPVDVDAGADYHMFRVASYEPVTEYWDTPGIQLSYPDNITAAGPIFGALEFYIGEQVMPIQRTPMSDARGIQPNCFLQWDPTNGATSYLFELYRDPTKTPIKAGRVTDSQYEIIYPFVALGYDTTYYWRVRAAYGNISSDWSPLDSFTVGTPDSVIENDIVRIHFVHGEGRIDGLVNKRGSNRELLHKTLNTTLKGGLNRVNSETGTKCTSWNINPISSEEGTAEFNYFGSYGTKKVELAWRTDLGFEMKVTYELGGQAKFSPGVYWTPGGDIGPQYDFVTIIEATGRKVLRYSSYPLKDSILYNGMSLGSGVTDTRFDETFGFKNPPTDSLYVATGAALNGPYNREALRGTVTREFAVKPTSAYWEWVNQVQEPFYNISAADGGATWFTDSPQSLTWMSNPDFLDSLVNITLSTDGGRTFPHVLATDVQNTGSFIIMLPSGLSSTNSRIRIELAGHPEYNGMNNANFTIRPSDAVVISTLPSVTSAPGETFILPYYIDPNGKNIYAFETRITFNKALLSMSKFRLGANLPPGWMISVSDSSARGFVQVGGFCRKDSLDFPIQYADTAVVFTFTVKPTARVGGYDTLKIENSYLEAAGVNAQRFAVSGNDCQVAFHSALSGRLSYYSNRKALNHAVRITYAGLGNAVELPINAVVMTDSLGKFDFSPIPPGAAVTLSVEPSDSVGVPAIDTSITAGDALLAFLGRDGGPTPLAGYQKIAADVNGDMRVTSTDAFAILQRATGGLPAFTDLDLVGGRGNWVFVDSAYKMTAFNWTAAPKTRAYDPLDTARLKENFYGILLGDVLPTFGGKSATFKKDYSMGDAASTDHAFAAGAVQFSVPKVMTASMGDTIEIPIMLNANKNPVGSFNATVRYNTSMLKYLGKFARSTKLAGLSGWTMEVYGNNSTGKVSVGAADLEQFMHPIVGSGEAIRLKFVVVGSHTWVDSSDIVFTTMAATDTVAANLSISAFNGRIVTTGWAGVPKSFALMQNYPNPFNPSTRIIFALPDEAVASVAIYNLLGQTVRTFETAQFAAGFHEVVWDGKNNDRQTVASGVYFYRLSAVTTAGVKFNEVKRMMLLK